MEKNWLRKTERKTNIRKPFGLFHWINKNIALFHLEKSFSINSLHGVLISFVLYIYIILKDHSSRMVVVSVQFKLIVSLAELFDYGMELTSI